jgi:zinc/manganese transport system substrate-binding protein
VVASTNVWGNIAETVGGTQAQVTSLISSPDQDPHSFTASARDELAVTKADVVIENGGGYDDFMDALTSAGDAHPTVINAVDVSARRSHSGSGFNEHVWYDLPTAERMARRMATAFARADPRLGTEYHRNAAAFTDDVDRLIHREALLKERLGGVAVAVTEPVPGYMLDAIGADNLTPAQFSAAVEEDGDVSVSTLDQTLSLLTDHRVAALVYNTQTSDPLTERVKAAAADAGVPVVAVTETLPSGMGYVTWMSDNLDHLVSALSSS